MRLFGFGADINRENGPPRGQLLHLYRIGITYGELKLGDERVVYRSPRRTIPIRLSRET